MKTRTLPQQDISRNMRDISDSFTAARQQARGLADFPGALPETLEEAYAIQSMSIAAWPDEVAGWKVGMVPPDYRARFADSRLAGPIFKSSVHVYGGEPIAMPVFADGFAAIEAEFVFIIGRDIAPSPQPLSLEQAAEYVSALHIGVEIASSPLPTINDLGPTSIISDFGNNAGLIIGPEIAGWQSIAHEDLPVRVVIDGGEAGSANASAIPDGGPIAAVAFLIPLLGRRGIRLKAGDAISSGAVTGVHQAPVGAVSRADFGAFGAIDLSLVAAG
ncbi:2-keto-4-pentenoate hydratase [Aquisalinus flavus]|nr:fumarylacetoacetate hydrolase family protein [Aquisalinus flavus]MBD0427421.1 fumarylacetoacetate hydrolase family protein [Aquisalinus flavus]UNE47224.1 2-keto-4-pentenoate hydratase [Aquisalinus flavus]